MQEPVGTARARQEARLLRRVIEAANGTSATPVPFGQITDDIVATLDWGSGRVLDVVGLDLQPADAGSLSGPFTGVAVRAQQDGSPQAGPRNDGGRAGPGRVRTPRAGSWRFQ